MQMCGDFEEIALIIVYYWVGNMMTHYTNEMKCGIDAKF